MRARHGVGALLQDARNEETYSAGVARRGPLRVLVMHNRYQQPGGEDAVVRDEVEMLRRYGVEVHLYERHNDQVVQFSLARLAAGTVWSRSTTRDLEQLVEDFRPDVIHAHNTFPLISPSLYFGAARLHIPVVQTLHNFRLFCAQAMFMRDGGVCEDCMGKLPWRGVLHRCYRGSAAQSAALVGMLGAHRLLGTYRHRVTRYIALNGFCRDKFIEAGLPAERLVIKPNFVDLPASEPQVRSGALFVGRLSPEKGMEALSEAAHLLPEGAVEVIGEGPAQESLLGLPALHLAGRRAPEEIYARMRKANCLLLPSIWYENFPRVLVEAFACGLPVIASRLGAMADIVEEGVTGLLFTPGDARELAEKILWAQANPERMRRMGESARAEYERKYTSQVNFQQLMGIYREALAFEDGRSRN